MLRRRRRVMARWRRSVVLAGLPGRWRWGRDRSVLLCRLVVRVGVAGRVVIGLSGRLVGIVGVGWRRIGRGRVRVLARVSAELWGWRRWRWEAKRGEGGRVWDGRRLRRRIERRRDRRWREDGRRRLGGARVRRVGVVAVVEGRRRRRERRRRTVRLRGSWWTVRRLRRCRRRGPLRRRWNWRRVRVVRRRRRRGLSSVG